MTVISAALSGGSGAPAAGVWKQTSHSAWIFGSSTSAYALRTSTGLVDTFLTRLSASSDFLPTSAGITGPGEEAFAAEPGLSELFAAVPPQPARDRATAAAIAVVATTRRLRCVFRWDI